MSGKLKYWRADNMWAQTGQPDGNLGMESISLPVREHQVFVTDWKHEKRRNDGTTYYGSHGRKIQNAGTVPIDVVLVGSVSAPLSSTLLRAHDTGGVAATVNGTRVRLRPFSGAVYPIRNDIAQVLVPDPKYLEFGGL